MSVTPDSHLTNKPEAYGALIPPPPRFFLPLPLSSSVIHPGLRALIASYSYKERKEEEAVINCGKSSS